MALLWAAQQVRMHHTTAANTAAGHAYSIKAGCQQEATGVSGGRVSSHACKAPHMHSSSFSSTTGKAAAGQRGVRCHGRRQNQHASTIAPCRQQQDRHSRSIYMAARQWGDVGIAGHTSGNVHACRLYPAAAGGTAAACFNVAAKQDCRQPSKPGVPN